MSTQIALVGIGKIAVDRHIPSITASADWELAATVSRRGFLEGVERFTDLHDMLSKRSDISVVSLCLPPVPRFAAARTALEAGRHVMLEKPPGATLAECHELEELATARGLALFASWHSREAVAVGAARDWLKDREVRRAYITWREDVRKWHPNQDWVFEPGGMGVFDPGINALSILTEILPKPIHLRSASLSFPENRQTPIAAGLVFSGNVSAEFDWRERERDIWKIEVVTDHGILKLIEGGSRMFVDDIESSLSGGHPRGEYPRLYARMARLVATRGIEMDLRPMVHIADAFMIGQRLVTERFEW